MTVLLALGIICVDISAVWGESIPVDSSRWQLVGKAKVDDYLGRLFLSRDGGSAVMKDFEMMDGVIDLDMAGSGARGFYNIFSRSNPMETAS